MAVTNQEQILADVQDARSPEGDFFVSSEGQVNGLDLGFLDYGVGQTAQNAVRLYQLLQKRTHEHRDPWEPKLDDVTRQAAEEEIAALNESIREYVAAQKGFWLLGVTRPPIAAASALAKFEQYRVKPPDTFPEDVFLVPSSSVTGGGALSCRVFGRVYRPVLDLRVKFTGSKQKNIVPDPPIYYFSRTTQEMVATPSLGRWFRFPLETLKLARFDTCILE